MFIMKLKRHRLRGLRNLVTTVWAPIQVSRFLVAHQDTVRSLDRLVRHDEVMNDLPFKFGRRTISLLADHKGKLGRAGAETS